MPILERSPGADGAAMSQRVAVPRRGTVSRFGVAAPPPEDLLPSGGTDPTWSDSAFRHCVEDIHRQLAPLRSRAALVASYGREAGRLVVDGQVTHAPSGSATPLQVAYALRWLELGQFAPRTDPAWADLFEGPVE